VKSHKYSDPKLSCSSTVNCIFIHIFVNYKLYDRSLQFQIVKFGNERKNQDAVGDTEYPLGDGACEVKFPASFIRSPLYSVA
jgi:hypothetical protein